MHRLFADSILQEGVPADISKDDLHHAKDVLRLSQGETVMLSDPAGNEAEGTVRTDGGFAVIPGPVSVAPEMNEKKITLYMGLAKGEKFEFIVQKAVELGVSEIVPVLFSRCVVRLKNKADTDKKTERWNRIAKSAAMQSGRAYIPKVTEPKSISELEDEIRNSCTVLAYELERECSINDISGLMRDAEHISLIVGPEGGISEEEADMMVSFGAHSVTLGRRILRCETAPVALLSIVQYETGGFSL